MNVQDAIVLLEQCTNGTGDISGILNEINEFSRNSADTMAQAFGDSSEHVVNFIRVQHASEASIRANATLAASLEELQQILQAIQ